MPGEHTHPTREALLDRLPASAREGFVAARAAFEQRDRAKASLGIRQAFDGVGFPERGDYPRFAIFEELTEDQRALATLVALDGGPFHYSAGMPARVDAAKRWAGLSEAGPLEQIVELDGRRVPVWRALQEGFASDDDTTPQVVGSLPVRAQLEVLAALPKAESDYALPPLDYHLWRMEVVAGLKEEGREWALSVLNAAAGGDPDDAPIPGADLAYFCLVRAKAPIDPAYDAHFPLGADVPDEIILECAKALPTARFEAAALSRLRREHGHYAIQKALMLLGEHDSEEIARFVVEKSENSAPHERKAERAKLAEIAKRAPGVAKVVGAVAPGPAPRALTVVSRLAPRREGDLTGIQAEQLIAAGKAWDGETLPVGRRLSLDENDEAAIGACLELVVLAENGAPVFDAWLYAGDSGTFFETGTTKIVAERIQFGIHVRGGKDPALEEALSEIRVSKAGLRSVEDVATATYAGSAVRAAKKAVRKKPSPKKAEPKKGGPKKAVGKKAVGKKAAPGKAIAKKAARPTAKKPASKKAAPTKPASKKAVSKKSRG